MVRGAPYFISEKIKVDYIYQRQKSFDKLCRIAKIEDTRISSFWFIADIIQGDNYYLDYSDLGAERIFSFNRHGQSKLFAEIFLEFMDKF